MEEEKVYMQPIEPEISVKVFISYAHADQELREKLEEHLSSLKHAGKITIWQDQEIPAGANWKDQIDTHLNGADLILLLVSSGFIASEYCWNKEVQAALERHKSGVVRVIPLILKPALWEDTPLGQLQALPTGAKPVTQWNDLDAAFDDVARGIRKVVEDLQIRLRQEAQKKAKIVPHFAYSRSTRAIQSVPQDAPKTSSTHKRHAGKRTFLLIGAVLGFLLLLIAGAVISEIGTKSSNTTRVTSPTTPTPTPTPTVTITVTATAIKSSSTASVTSQMATTTAKTPGVAGTATTDAENLNRFYYGQDTYWANMRYHQLTGHWVPWNGNANQWPSQAASYGWTVSSQPHIPSIIALDPYVQGAGYYGHVGIAESMNGTNITTSNWNYGGAWATTTYVTFQAGSGIHFIYYPGS